MQPPYCVCFVEPELGGRSYSSSGFFRRYPLFSGGLSTFVLPGRLSALALGGHSFKQVIFRVFREDCPQ